MLHIFTKATQDNLQQFIRLSGNKENNIILLNDSVFWPQDLKVNYLANVYLLQEHVKAFGLKLNPSNPVKLIDYEAWVNLTTVHNKILSW